MIYNKKLKNQIYTYCVKRLGMFDYKAGWLKGDCPYCGRPNKFGVNLFLNRTNCFVCGNHAKPFFMVKELEQLSENYQVFNILSLGDSLIYKEPEIEKIISDKPLVNLPDGYKPINYGDSKLAKMARRYLINRGFNIEELSKKGYGYGTKGEYLGYIIIPFFYEGSLVYYNTRAFVKDGVKYKNPGMEDSGVAKSMILYNRDSLFIYDKIYLVEGALNADTLGDQGIATGGKKISKYQISDIVRSPVSKVVILLDPDAYEESVKLSFDLIEHKEIKLVKLPSETDVNDLGKSKTMRLIKKSPWLDYNKLMELNNEKPSYSYR